MTRYFLYALCCLMTFPALAQNTLSPEQVSSIDQLFNDLQGKPGCSVAILKAGVPIFHRAYGLANLDYDVPVTTATVFDMASLSKQFTAACIYLLEQEGQLKLDDPIQHFLPEMPQYDAGEITLRHLLHHTSGIRDYLALLYTKGIYWGNDLNNLDVLSLLSNQSRLQFKPGSTYQYSNSNYVLLALIVARASGVSLGQYAQEKIFDPLDMQQTFYLEEKERVVKNRAIGYQTGENAFVMDHLFGSEVVGDGGLYSSTEDLIKWSNNFKTAEVGGNTFLDQMLSVGTLSDGKSISYAGGLILGDYQGITGIPTIGHSGQWAGFRSLYFHFVEQDLTFWIVSNNGELEVWDKLNRLVPLFLSEDIAEAREAMTAVNQVPSGPETIPKALSPSALQQWRGSYFNTLSGYTRSIELVEDQLLFARPDGRKTPLTAMAENELIFAGMPFVKLSLQKTTPLTIKMVIDDQTPIVLEKFQAKSYRAEALKEYENNYYNEDINVTWRVSAKDDQLLIHVNNKELVQLTPIAQDLFTEIHFGYIKFKRNGEGKIVGFVRNDDAISDLHFVTI